MLPAFGGEYEENWKGKGLNNRNWFGLAVFNIKNVIMAKVLCYIFFFSTIIFFEYTAVKIIVLVVMIFMYPLLLAVSMRNEGAHDRNFVNLGKIEKDIYKSFWAGFALSVPYLVSWILLLVFRLLDVFPAYFGIFKFFNIQYSPLFLLIQADPWFLANSIWDIFIFLIPVILLPFVSFISYLLGFNNIWLVHGIMYKKRK